MKKLLLYVIILIANVSFSQEKLAKDNSYLKAIKLEKTDHESLSFLNDAKISWDFSTLDTKNVAVNIEVVTFFDCFNGANGSDINSQFFLLSKENFKTVGSAQIKHDETRTKCFKWRLKLTENNVEKFSEWFYFIYLKE